MGFDIECIQNIQSLAGEYFCPVCRLLVYPDEALQTQCTHLYCKPCLAYVVSNTHTCPYDGYPVTEAEAKPLKEVNQALAETIGHIAVTCLYHRSGCTWQGTLSESTNHCSGCSFGNSPVMCNRCGAQIVHRQVLEHSQICPGEQPLAQQVENTTAATEQGQTTTQAGVPASQDQNSQNAVAAAGGQGQSQGAPVAQPPAVVHAPTPEQWYQQQQQYYQQYYQQYPGYDPYQQQYQQYAQYHQQQLQQQVQAHPQQQVMPGQPHPQPYMQPPPQPHVQPQPQVQPQLQTQVQVPVQSQPQVQPQPQAQPQGQPQPQASQAQAQAQPQPQPQMPVQPQLQPQVNPQPQPHAPVQPHPQMQPQTHPPSHAQIQAHPLGHLPHSQQHPQAHPQAHPQQHSQMSHPQPHPQLPHARPHVQHPPQQQPHHPHAQPQSHPQHPHMQWQPPPTQPPPYLQAPPQTHPPHFQPQPQPQPINPAAHAVTGHQSYQQPRPHQQMPQGSAQQHPMNVHPQPQVAAHQLPQNPSQFPHQQTPHMRPPNPVPHSHGPGQHPHQPSMLPAQGQHPNAPPVQQQQQQQQSYPQAHQPGHQIQHPPGMQPLQHQPMPHQQAHGIVHQSQPFPGAAPPSALNQPSQQGILMPLQPMQQQQPFRAQAPSSLQQHAQNHLQWQHNVPSSQGMMSHQQQNPSGRPVMPVHATMQQPYLHPAGGAAGPTHGQDSRALVKPGQVGGDQLRESLVPQPGSQTKVSATDGPSILSREDSVPEKVSKVPEGEAETVSNGKDSTTARIVVDSADSKISKSENNSKSRDDEDKPQVGTADGDAPTGRGKDMESSNTKADSEEPAKKPMVNEEASERLSADMALENHEDVLKMDEVSLHAVKEEQDGVPHGSLSSQKLEALEGKNVKMQQDAVDPRSSQLLLDAKNAIPKGHVSGNEKSSVHVSQQLPAAISIEKNPPQQSLQNVGPNLDRPLNRPGYQDGIMPQFPRQGPGPDEYRGFPPPVQMPTAQSGYPAPSPFGQPPLIPDGPQRPPAPHQMHMQGPMRPQGPLQGHPSTFHGSVPTGILPAASFGREPGHFGHPQGIFEPHPTPQGANQGPMPPPHAGGPRFSQGEAFAGPPLSGLPPGPFGSPRGMVARGPPQGSEGQIGRLHSTNPMQAEMFANRRPGFFDGKGLVGGTTEDRFKPYPERLKPIPEESLKLPPEDHFKPFSLEQSHRVIDRREFEEDLKQFPRPAHLDSETKFENHLSASRHLDRVQHGFGVDRPLGFGCDVVPDGSGSFPVGSAGPSVHPVDIGDRTRPANLTDSMGKKMDAAGSRPDVLGPVSDYGRHRMDMPARSPGRDYPGIPPRRFGGSSAFGLGSGSLPSHLRRGEADGPRNFMAGEPFGSGNLPVHLRNSDLAGSDIVPGHMRAGEHLGPRHIPGHLRIGEALGPDHLRMLEPTGFGGFPSHLRMGELAGPGNLPSHLPGFGSTMPIYGLPNEGGFFNQGSKGDMESFDHSRKRKPGSMGWCRICKIDCETVEGLELHSQTREHQKMAMDMVLSIKQDNAKKQKVSSEDRVSLEDANKSRKPGFENRGNRR